MSAAIILGPDVTSSLASLTQRPNEWPIARSRIQALRLYAQELYQDESANAAGGVGENYFPKLVEDGFFAQIAAWGLPLDLEAPFVKSGWGCNGVEPLRLTQLALERARSVGCPIRNVSADEPLLAECGTWQDRADMTARNIAMLRVNGQHNIDLTFAFRANTAAQIVAFTERVQQLGHDTGTWTSPTGMDIDFDPYSLHDQLGNQAEQVGGAELRDLQAHCRAWGIPFRVIPTTRGDTPQAYHDGILNCIGLIRQLLGGDPDAYILESWEGVPGGLPVNLAETDPLSHTALVNDVSRLIGKDDNMQWADVTVQTTATGTVLVNGDGTVRSLNPSSATPPYGPYHWESRPAGTDGGYERCAINGATVAYNPVGETVAFAFQATIPNKPGMSSISIEPLQ